MRRKSSIFFLTLCCLVCFISESLAADKPVVFVSIVPQEFFVEQIGGGLFDVEVMVQPGANPTTYEPKPSQMAKLSRSVLYFAIGVPFEKAWLGKIRAVNPEMHIVFTDKNIDKIAMVGHYHEVSGQNGDIHHRSGILDPHIWLSPNLVKKQAAVILAALKSIVPRQSIFLEKNYQVFIKKITTLDGQLRAVFQGERGRQFMVFHPSWGYFAREYGLKQIAVELEGKTPKLMQLQNIIHYARTNNIHILFVQPQFSTKKAKVIAREIDGEVVTADPLAKEWFANLRGVAEKFKNALR